MKNEYLAYTREVNDSPHYFVKKFICLPEYSNVPLILDSMGMHTDFIKACDIAGVEEMEVINDLMKQLNLTKVSGKVVPVHLLERKESNSMLHSLYRNTQHLLAKLRLAHI